MSLKSPLSPWNCSFNEYFQNYLKKMPIWLIFRLAQSKKPPFLIDCTMFQWILKILFTNWTHALQVQNELQFHLQLFPIECISSTAQCNPVGQLWPVCISCAYACDMCAPNCATVFSHWPVFAAAKLIAIAVDNTNWRWFCIAQEAFFVGVAKG